MSLLRNRDFHLLLTGQTFASIGSSMTGLAMSLLAYDLSQNAGLAALTLTGSITGYLVASLPAGALADRWNRKVVMIWSALIQCVALGTVPVAIVLGHLTLLQLWLVAAVCGVMGAMYEPAQQASIKRIVEPAELGTAMTVDQARASLGQVAGPPLAGIAYAFTRWLPFACEALAQLVVAVLTMGIRTELKPTDTGTKTTLAQVFRDIREGIAYLLHDPTLRTVAFIGGLVNLGFSMVAVTVTLALRAQGETPQVIGLVQTVVGVAGLAGALLATPVVAKVRLGLLVPVTFVLTFASAAALAFVPSWWGVAAILGALMLALPSINAGIMTVFMASTPDRVLGRVSSALMLSTMGLTPLGSSVGGFLLEYAGRPWAIGSGAAILLVTTLISAASPVIRQLGLAKDLQPVDEPEPVPAP